mmetsp:Transcript_55254/g.110940  ORF Transcript_55254/g.110940 Transcript_55254/m.110940 type:complete len:403 (+) Transcript_55254:93-1301(+)
MFVRIYLLVFFLMKYASSDLYKPSSLRWEECIATSLRAHVPNSWKNHTIMNNMQAQLGPSKFKAIMHRQQPDVDALTQTITPDMLVASRPADVKKEAQRQVSAAETGSAVWFKHMRKAGGTSVLFVLDKAYHAQKSCGKLGVHRPQDNYSDYGYTSEVGFTLHHQEFTLFPVRCLLLQPRTLYITVIREPVERSISLFFYDGPGKYSNATKTDWIDWMDEGVSLMMAATSPSSRVKVTGADGYLPNFQARSLTATCVIAAGARSCGRDNFGQSEFHTPGCRTSREATDLAMAKAVIDAFDLSLVVEQFDFQGPSLLIQRLLGVPGLWLHNARRAKRARTVVPRVVLKRLAADNLVDAALHEYTKEKAVRAMKALSSDLLRAHGVGMGGYDPFGSTSKLKMGV